MTSATAACFPSKACNSLDFRQPQSTKRYHEICHLFCHNVNVLYLTIFDGSLRHRSSMGLPVWSNDHLNGILYFDGPADRFFFVFDSICLYFFAYVLVSDIQLSCCCLCFSLRPSKLFLRTSSSMTTTKHNQKQFMRNRELCCMCYMCTVWQSNRSGQIHTNYIAGGSLQSITHVKK